MFRKNNSGMSKKDMDVNEHERLSNITLTHSKGTSRLLLLFNGEKEPGLVSLSIQIYTDVPLDLVDLFSFQIHVIGW